MIDRLPLAALIAVWQSCCSKNVPAVTQPLENTCGRWPEKTPRAHPRRPRRLRFYDWGEKKGFTDCRPEVVPVRVERRVALARRHENEKLSIISGRRGETQANVNLGAWLWFLHVICSIDVSWSHERGGLCPLDGSVCLSLSHSMLLISLCRISGVVILLVAVLLPP